MVRNMDGSEIVPFLFFYSVLFFIFGFLFFKKKQVVLPFFLLVFSFIATLAFRDENLGIDTIIYVTIFKTLNFNLYPLEIDPLFKLLIFAIRSISDNGCFFLFVCYFILNLNVILSFYLLNKKTFMISYSLFVVTFLFYNLHLNILRQGLSLSFMFLAFALYCRGLQYKSYFFMLIALLFHGSSIVGILVYFAKFIKRIDVCFVISFLLMLSSSLFMDDFIILLSRIAEYHWLLDKLYRYTSWKYLTPFSFKLQHILALFLLFVSVIIVKVNDLDLLIKDRLCYLLRILILGFVPLAFFSFDQMVADRMYMFFYFINIMILSELFLIVRDRRLIFMSYIFYFTWLGKTLFIQFPIWFIYKTFMAN